MHEIKKEIYKWGFKSEECSKGTSSMILTPEMFHGESRGDGRGQGGKRVREHLWDNHTVELN